MNEATSMMAVYEESTGELSNKYDGGEEKSTGVKCKIVGRRVNMVWINSSKHDGNEKELTWGELTAASMMAKKKS